MTNKKMITPLTLIRVELNMLASFLMVKRLDQAHTLTQTKQSMSESGMTISKKAKEPTHMQMGKMSLKENGKITSLFPQRISYLNHKMIH